jgi:chitinase
MTPEERAFAAAQAAAPAPAEAPRRRISVLRIAVLIVVVAAACASIVAFRSVSRSARSLVVQSAFMPYVDATATPQYAFENAHESNLVLGFVVSSAGDACEPSWGGSYSLDSASTALDLDRRVARFGQRRGQVAVSFGGAANSELANGCTDIAKLTAAYRAVVQRYSVGTIDLDLEGDTALSSTVVARRAQALHTVQQQARAAGDPLQIWLTLPVDPSGLTSAGSAALATMLNAKVTIAGVNGLIMDYGSSLPKGMSLTTASESALTHLADQVRSAFAAAGHKVSAARSWQLIGATPMIGQNDSSDERFDLRDAAALVRFAEQKHLRRMSMWSLNRDQACGPNYANVTIVSPNCSGIAQRAGQFAKIFQAFKAGKPVKFEAGASASPSPTGTSIVDDPATSPYPIWNPTMPYAAGTKIVWHRNVYQAKWWTKGDTPDAPVSSSSQTPWTLIGPVLPGEHPKPTPTMAAGTYPKWSATKTYRAGTRVLFDGIGFQAKWYTRGDVPGITVNDPGQTPWELISSK